MLSAKRFASRDSYPGMVPRDLLSLPDLNMKRVPQLPDCLRRQFRLARNKVRGIVWNDETEHTYERRHQPLPKLGEFAGRRMQILQEDAQRG